MHHFLYRFLDRKVVSGLMQLRHRIVTVFRENVLAHLNEPKCVVSQMQKCVKLIEMVLHCNQMRYSPTPQENPIPSYEGKQFILMT